MEKKVLIHTRENCIYCQNIKEWMNTHQINFEEVTVTEIKDIQLLNEIKGVPYTIVSNNGEREVIKGFNIGLLSELLLS
ncbi:glutaredoxin family protein [Paenibacillus sp. SI8]|uniref:glutaredoxin family protein n=1 Tax=unclassified Paenibacillus TaxID=185978 RepID=UPI003465E9A7